MHAITATSVQAAAHASTAPLTAGLRVPSLGPCPLARPRSIPAQKAAPSDMRPATTFDAMCGPAFGARSIVPATTAPGSPSLALPLQLAALRPAGDVVRAERLTSTVRARGHASIEEACRSAESLLRVSAMWAPMPQTNGSRTPPPVGTTCGASGVDGLSLGRARAAGG